jgi:hypothetical protein
MMPIMCSTSVEAFFAGDGQVQRQRLQAILEADEDGRLARRVMGFPERQVLATETSADGAIALDRHVHQRLHDLMGASEPAARDQERLCAGDVGAAKNNLSGLRRVDAVDQIEQRRFASAVRPDQAQNFALAQHEAQVVHGLQAAEALADVVELQDRRHSSTFWVRGKRL